MVSSIRNEYIQRDDYQKTLQAAKPLLEDLSAWYKDLEQDSENIEDRDDAPVTCSNILKLGNHYIKTNIFRAIMRPFLTAENPLNPLPPDAREAMKHARASARSCTRGAFEFIWGLNQDHLPRFWPQWTRSVYSAISYFMLLMFITSESFEEARYWIIELQMLRKELRIKQNLHTFLRLGQIRIDAVFSKDMRDVVDLKPHVRSALDETSHTVNSRQARPT